jgi:hypothetical protein
MEIEQPMTTHTREPEPFMVVHKDDLLGFEDKDWTITQEEIRHDKRGLPVPFFTILDLSKFFFGASPDWMRWRIRERFFVMGGDPACPHGVKNVPTGETDGKGKPVKQDVWWFSKEGVCRECGAIDYGSPQRKSEDNNTRIYSLADVERMNLALFQRGTIDAARHLTIKRIVKSSAALYGYLPG